MATKTLSQLIGGIVKSTQRGLAVIGSGSSTQNVTITSVDLDKSFLSYGGSNASADARGLVTMRLTSSTNILVVKGTSGGLTTAAWEVIEYE